MIIVGYVDPKLRKGLDSKSKYGNHQLYRWLAKPLAGMRLLFYHANMHPLRIFMWLKQ